MKTYDISKLDYDTQFNLGYSAFFHGRALDTTKPAAWVDGWNRAFSDVMAEHEGRVGRG